MSAMRYENVIIRTSGWQSDPWEALNSEWISSIPGAVSFFFFVAATYVVNYKSLRILCDIIKQIMAKISNKNKKKNLP